MLELTEMLVIEGLNKNTEHIGLEKCFFIVLTPLLQFSS